MTRNSGVSEDTLDKAEYRAHLRQLLRTIATTVIATALLAASVGIVLVRSRGAAPSTAPATNPRVAVALYPNFEAGHRVAE